MKPKWVKKHPGCSSESYHANIHGFLKKVTPNNLPDSLVASDITKLLLATHYSLRVCLTLGGIAKS
jgi:hypothetical protein